MWEYSEHGQTVFFPQGKVLAKDTERLNPNYLEKDTWRQNIFEIDPNKSGGPFYCSNAIS